MYLGPVINVSYLLYLHTRAPEDLAEAICFATVLYFYLISSAADGSYNNRNYVAVKTSFRSNIIIAKLVQFSSFF